MDQFSRLRRPTPTRMRAMWRMRNKKLSTQRRTRAVQFESLTGASIVVPRSRACHLAHFDQDRTAQRLARRIRELGYQVEISEAA